MDFVYERNVALTTRDGVMLRADVWRPVEGTAPTLLMRLPYRRTFPGLAGGPGGFPSLLAFLDAGYAVMWQDTRGTFTSDGSFEPKVDEIADGEDTVAWITLQAWSDGTVGGYGGSYMGITQWAVDIGDAPALDAIAPTFTSMDWYSGLWYSPGGALSLSLVTWWNAVTYFNDGQRALQRGESADVDAMMRIGGSLLDPLTVNDATPVADLPLHGKGRWFDDWLAHPDFDDYWKPRTIDRWSGRSPSPHCSPAGGTTSRSTAASPTSSAFASRRDPSRPGKVPGW